MIMKNVKVHPMHTNVVVKIMDNKYRKVKTESGIFLPDGGLYQSQETGQIEKDLEQIIVYAEVVALGSECKYLKEGMGCYCDVRSLRPLPFQGKEYMQTNEMNILVWIEEEDIEPIT